MKAALIKKTGEPYVLDDIRVDDPIGHEVLVEVKGSGLCHSDLGIAENDYGIPLPLVQGHEVAGVAIAVGPDVESVKVGDHVVACPVYFCGHCDQCLQGRNTSCREAAKRDREKGGNARFTMPDGRFVMQLGAIGGFAEQTLINENQLVSIDRRVPFDRAALLGCGVVTGAGAVFNSANVRAGETVAVIGCGGVGLNAVQAAALTGAGRIIAVDLQPGKLELAKTFGATDLVNPDDGDPVEQVRDLTGGHGVDHAFEMIGLMPTLVQATQMLDHFGTAYIVGMQKPGTKLQLNVDPMVPTGMLMKEQAIRGVKFGSVNVKRDIALYADLYLQGRFNLDDLVSQTISLEQINAGFEELKKGRVARSVIVF
ncbi:Zn-dependent alcohol dehydrogenase [Arthrobacter sp. W4I7]|uniref:Zn-dependent alcohol dehydrogenase n=1 Tax=Arthrobacter sp. W4I7 TaxID=3042296 RepID=UPI00278B47CB|nr:Zn-dependent alcohol dehydrogenase [Arthrobacter sp. W4I7]MDQ0691425.1 S-(hydroxymethyl)glutathione dehydrogenase/alcohol dehydrogenase [Arthrobacter sp. W4I7]